MTEWPEKEAKRADACDIVVVGAGIVGAAVAARLALEGQETAVLEAQQVAGGATGRCAGMILTGLPGHYGRAVATYGRERAREIWALTGEGRQRLVATAELMEVPVEISGSLWLAAGDAEAEDLAQSATLLREDGFDISFDPHDPLERGFRAALRYPRDVTVDAVALAQALLTSSDAIVHEETEVRGVEPERGGVRVWARGRTILCNAVVLAINGYAPLLSAYFADKVTPTRGLLLTSEPLSDTVLEQPCSAASGYTYCRQLADRRLLFGTWWHSPAPGIEAENDADDRVQDSLRQFAARHFPEAPLQRTNGRSGLGGFTPDGLPIVGRLPDLPQVYFAVGLGGRGLAWASVLAERLTEFMLHDVDPGLLSAARLSSPESDLPPERERATSDRGFQEGASIEGELLTAFDLD